MSAKAPEGPGGPRRLLMVVNVAWFFVSHRLPLAIAARASGFQVHVAAGGATPAEIALLERHGLEFHPLQLERASMGVFDNIRLLWQLAGLYRAVRPAIVHHVTIKPVILGTLAARLVGIDAVVNAISGLGYAFTEADDDRSLTRWAAERGYRLCLRHSNMKVIVQNTSDAQYVAKIAGLTEGEIVLIGGSGVDLERFRPVPEPDVPPVVALVPARMLRDKGVQEFSRAIAALRSQGTKIEGWLVGGTDPGNPAAMDEAELRKLESECGVRWLGHRSDMERLMGQVHIVCLPSYREGLPKALAEAAAAGRPIVATDVPGCRDVVEHGVNGLLVPPREVAALSAALAMLAASSRLRESMGDAGRRLAEQQFDVNAIVRRTLAVYEELTGCVDEAM